MFFYQVVLFFVEFCKFAVAYLLLFDFKWRKKWYVILGDIVIICAGALYFTWWEYEWNPMFIYVGGFAVLSIISFTNIGKWYHFMGIFGWTVITTTLLDSMAYLLLDFQNDKMNHLGASIITVLFLFCLGAISYKKQGAFRELPFGYYIAFTVIGFVNQIVLSLLYEEVKDNTEFVGPFIIVVIGVFLQMSTVFLLAVANKTWKEKENLNREYFDTLEKHYLYLEKKEEETKKFRHDIRNHLYTLDELVNQGRIDEFHTYMKDIFGIVDNPASYANTGYSIVDAILNQYIDMFRQENIVFRIDGHFPVNCFVEPFDLCVIFSNMLQNALEAVRNWEEKEIRILLRYDDNGIYMKQENTYHSILIRNNSLVSTKSDSVAHGYGSKNMRESISKYRGTIDYKAENHKFELTIHLQCPISCEKKEQDI